METSIIRIGNSKGLRISKSILDLYHIGDSIELILEKDHIVLKPIAKPRQGWDEQFKVMTDSGDDALLIDDVMENEEFAY